MHSIIELREVSKAFGTVVAVDCVNLHVLDEEIICLLGPSGCGKTTSLRMIAGFDRPTSGEIRITDSLVSSPTLLIPPERRNLGMVFQNYAVWPHMTVFRNVAYPLKIRKLPRNEIQKRVARTIELAGLSGLEKRYPEQLSGGQQQRVALARALVVEPPAMLLDEPLSNLDAKLREKMRFEIMDLHQRTGISIVYVTHDQAEAMVLGDRIVVMNLGKTEQIGTPSEIYRSPVSQFVADFIGLANFIPVRLAEVSGEQAVAHPVNFPNTRLACQLARASSTVGDEGLLFVRPEDVDLVPVGQSELSGVIRRRTFLGNQVDYRVEALGVVWRIETNPGVHHIEETEIGLSPHRAVFLPDTTSLTTANAE